MAIIADYISEGGAHILVNDEALDNSPENRERIYRNLSQIITRIEMRKIEQKIMEEESKSKE
ncbi:MAG: hypothetical protein J6I65_03820 [Lachnospiraceae bacterium]|nr:hypothetical protein [Lachnospiraceae bacterium]